MRRCYGIREVIVAHFDERMMHMPWREFVTDYLAAEHGAVHLVAGHDFHFGYMGGRGNPERLRALCGQLGIGCDIIPKVEKDHITISSTYIRTLIAQGEMERANQFLGHPPHPDGHGGPRQEAGLHPGVPHGEPPLPARRAGARPRGVRHPGLLRERGRAARR